MLDYVSAGLVATTRADLDPGISSTLVMESAVAMSKITSVETLHERAPGPAGPLTARPSHTFV